MKNKWDGRCKVCGKIGMLGSDGKRHLLYCRKHRPRLRKFIRKTWNRRCKNPDCNNPFTASNWNNIYCCDKCKLIMGLIVANRLKEADVSRLQREKYIATHKTAALPLSEHKIRYEEVWDDYTNPDVMEG